MNTIFGVSFGQQLDKSIKLDPSIIDVKDVNALGIAKVVSTESETGDITNISAFVNVLENSESESEKIKKGLTHLGFENSKYSEHNIMENECMIAEIIQSKDNQNHIRIDFWHNLFSPDYKTKKEDFLIKKINLFGYEIGETIENDIPYCLINKHGITDEIKIYNFKKTNGVHYKMEAIIISKTHGACLRNKSLICEYLKRQSMNSYKNDEYSEHFSFAGEKPVDCAMYISEIKLDLEEFFCLKIIIKLEDFVKNDNIIGFVECDTKLHAFGFSLDRNTLKEDVAEKSNLLKNTPMKNVVFTLNENDSHMIIEGKFDIQEGDKFKNYLQKKIDNSVFKLRSKDGFFVKNNVEILINYHFKKDIGKIIIKCLK